MLWKTPPQPSKEDNIKCFVYDLHNSSEAAFIVLTWNGRWIFDFKSCESKKGKKQSLQKIQILLLVNLVRLQVRICSFSLISIKSKLFTFWLVRIVRFEVQIELIANWFDPGWYRTAAKFAQEWWFICRTISVECIINIGRMNIFYYAKLLHVNDSRAKSSCLISKES